MGHAKEETDPGQPTVRWAVRICWAIIFAVGLCAAFIVGTYSGRGQRIQMEGRRDVGRLYQFLKDGNVTGAIRYGILRPESAKVAVDAEEKWGRVLSAKIQWERAGPVGLPVIFGVSVTRSKGKTTEYVARHGAAMPLLEMWPDKPAGY